MTSIPITLFQTYSGQNLLTKSHKKPTFTLKKTSHILHQPNKQNLKETFNQPFLNHLPTNSNDEQHKTKHIFQIPSDKMINHDEQLKEYLSGDKIFKQKIHQVQDFSQHGESYGKQVIKATRHKKQKSKSQVSPHEITYLNSTQYTNRSSTHGNDSHFMAFKLSSSNQNVNFEEKGSDFLRRNQKNRRSIKFLDPNQQRFKQVELKSLEMQLIVRKANQKRKTMINEIIKKLNLPQLNPRVSHSLRTLIEASPQHDMMQSEHKSIHLSNAKDKKITIGKNLAMSISKVHEGKIKEFRRLQKEIYLNKMKFNQTKDNQVTSRCRNNVKQAMKLQNFRLFGR